MHIEIAKTGRECSAAEPMPEIELAGGEPGRVRPGAGTRVGMAADTVRPVGPGGASPSSGPALLVQVDGQTVIEMAGFPDAPAVMLEGGGWMPAAPPESTPSTGPAIPSFFGQATNDKAPLLGGTAEAGSLVLVGVGGAVFCITASAEGSWSLDTALAVPMSGRFELGEDGTKQLLVTSIDSHGNSSGVAGVFVLNTTPPRAALLHTEVVASTTPVLRGSAQAGSSVMIGIGGAIYVVAADEEGGWSVDTGSALPVSGQLHLGADGGKPVVMACTDAAGNTSTSEARLTLDTSPAQPPSAVQHPASPTPPPRSPVGSTPLLAGMVEVTRGVLATWGGRRRGLSQQQRRG